MDWPTLDPKVPVQKSDLRTVEIIDFSPLELILVVHVVCLARLPRVHLEDLN